MRTRRISFTGFGIAALTLPLVIGVSLSPAVAAPPGVHTVVSHLNNPRGLAIDGAGHIWIAEAGAGGTHCQGSGGNATCVGLTASVSMVDHGALTRVVRGLISVGGEGGVAAIGVSSVATANGQIRALLGESGFGVPPSGFPQNLLNAARAQLGQLISVNAVRGVDHAGGGRQPRLHLDQEPRVPAAGPVPGRQPERRGIGRGPDVRGRRRS